MLKQVLILITICSIGAFATNAQTYTYSYLSKKYNYRISALEEPNQDSVLVISQIDIAIINKATKKTEQSIVLEKKDIGNLAGGFYSDDMTVRSYITGVNKDQPVKDRDGGELIIADFNFDGREDFAIKTDMEGEAGPLYSFYTMGSDGKFVRDDFLSQTVLYFPDIDAKNKTLITYTHANPGAYYENIYKYEPAHREWKKVKSVYKEIR